MKSCYYAARNPDTNDQVHLIMVFDENQKCLFCDRPVGQSSMGGTAVCGACDSGHSSKSGRKIRHYERGKMPSVWCNVSETFEFSTREEAEKKMYELHQSGISGWEHIIKKLAPAEETIL